MTFFTYSLNRPHDHQRTIPSPPRQDSYPSNPSEADMEDTTPRVAVVQPTPRTVVQQDLVERNAFYADNFNGGDLPTSPKRHYILVTCMDARLDVPAAFGNQLGDAHIIRNAGGSAQDALRSIIVSQQFLGTSEIVVIKHTQCGMQTFSNEQAREVVKERLGPKAAAEVGTLDFLPFTDLVEAVKEDCAFLQSRSAVLAETTISGWVYDVKTGRVTQVV